MPLRTKMRAVIGKSRCSRRVHCVQPPFTWDASKLVRTAILEEDARASDEIFDRT